MKPRSLPRHIILLACVLLAAAGTSATTKKPPLRPIHINTATANELQLVAGIGPATAEKILVMRKSYGPFKSVDDLLAIKGPGPQAPRQDAQVPHRWQSRAIQQNWRIIGEGNRFS